MAASNLAARTAATRAVHVAAASVAPAPEPGGGVFSDESKLNVDVGGGNSTTASKIPNSRHAIMDTVDKNNDWETALDSWHTLTKHGSNLLVLHVADPLPELGVDHHERPISITNLKDYSGLWPVVSVSKDRKTIICEIKGEYPAQRKWEVKRVLHDDAGRVFHAKTGKRIFNAESIFENIAANKNAGTVTDADTGASADDRDTLSEDSNDDRALVPGRKLRACNVICAVMEQTDSPATVRFAPCLNFMVRSTIFSISAVDTVNQTFDGDVFCEFRLPHFSLSPNKNDTEEAMKVYGINPYMFQIQNGGGETERWETFEPCQTMIGSFSYVYKFRTKGTFSEEMELQTFPFDIQGLSITVALTKSCAMARFEVNNAYPSIYVLSNFRLNNLYVVLFREIVMATMNFSDSSHSASSNVYSHVSYSVLMLRKPSYYLNNIAYPVFVLSILAFLAMGIETDGNKIGVGDRIAIILTLLLTAVAYKFVVASSLPQVSYLTILDQYVLLCFGFLVIISLCATIYPYFEYLHPSRFTFVLEFYISLGMLVIFVALNVCIKRAMFTWMRRRYSRKLKMTVIEVTRRVVARLFTSLTSEDQLELLSASLARKNISLKEAYCTGHDADDGPTNLAMKVMSTVEKSIWHKGSDKRANIYASEQDHIKNDEENETHRPSPSDLDRIDVEVNQDMQDFMCDGVNYVGMSNSMFQAQEFKKLGLWWIDRRKKATS